VGSFLSRLVLFVLPIIVVLAVLEIRLRTIPTTYEAKHKQTLAIADSVEVLALGSSHALKGFCASRMSVPAYNLANVSQTWSLDYAMLKQYGPMMPRLRWVVLSASYFSLWEDLAKADPRRLYFYKRFHNISSPLGDEFTFANTSFLGMYGPRLGLRLALSPTLGEGKGLGEDGWQAMPVGSTDDLTHHAAASRIQEHHSAMSYAHLGLNLAALDSIALYCKRRQLQLLVVQYPTHKWYQRQQQDYWTKPLDQHMQHFSVTRGVRYWNANHDMVLPDSAFTDSDHLSHVGARMVTQELDDLLNQISE